MELSQQVVSLELSKQLKELGVKQESLFYWGAYENPHINIYKEFDCPNDIWCIFFLKKEKCPPDYTISAFTVAELLELLPNRITLPKGEPFNSFRLRIEKSFYVKQCDLSENIIYKEDIYIVNYYCDSTACGGEEAWMVRSLTKNLYDKNPANALAKMLVYLIENGLIQKSKIERK